MSDGKKMLILIGGCAGAGKDSLANYLKEIIHPWTSVRTDAYAYTIKLIAHETLAIPWHILNAPKDVKETTLVANWSGEEITVRQALQDVGEWFRQRFGHLIWANMVKHRAQFATERVSIITDARHPEEEIHWIKKTCSEFARVFAVRIRRSSVPVKRGHPSEDKIDDEPDSTFDFIIENEGDLGALQKAATELACACVLLYKTSKKKVKRSGTGWATLNDSNKQVCEPLATEQEAQDAAEHYDGSTASLQPMTPHTIQKITFYNLKGSAVGS